MNHATNLDSNRNKGHLWRITPDGLSMMLLICVRCCFAPPSVRIVRSVFGNFDGFWPLSPIFSWTFSQSQSTSVTFSRFVTFSHFQSLSITFNQSKTQQFIDNRKVGVNLIGGIHTCHPGNIEANICSASSNVLEVQPLLHPIHSWL